MPRRRTDVINRERRADLIRDHWRRVGIRIDRRRSRNVKKQSIGSGRGNLVGLLGCEFCVMRVDCLGFHGDPRLRIWLLDVILNGRGQVAEIAPCADVKPTGPFLLGVSIRVPSALALSGQGRRRQALVAG
ncbi:MAG: hypothetical protein V3W34_14980 [Phycisphaerae bacterium]